MPASSTNRRSVLLFTACLALVVSGFVGALFVLQKTQWSNNSLLGTSSSSNGESESCAIEKGWDCSHLRKKCNLDYFWIAKYYYCSSFSPVVLGLLFMPAVVFVTLSLFAALSILAAKYLYPILRVICKELHINDKFLSCILVPVANCVPDLANVYISLNANSTDLALGEVIGSTLIVFTLVIGAICILQPFRIEEQRLLIINDFFLVLTVVSILLVVISDGKIIFTECLFLVMMYVLYVLYLVHNSLSSADDEVVAFENPDIVIEDDPEILLELESAVFTESDHLLGVNNFGVEDALSVLSSEIESHSSTEEVNTYGAIADGDDVGEKFPGKFSCIFLVIIHCIQTLYNLIDVSLFVFLPYNSEERDDSKTPVSLWLNWRRSEHTPLVVKITGYLRCFVIPLVFMHYFADISLVKYVSAVFLLLCWNHWLLAHTPRPLVFGIAILMMFVSISMTSLSILQILKNVGVIFKISETLLGLTIFAISNSINDIITNVTLASMGKPILGLNACLGTPLLSILLGIGFNGGVIILKKGSNLKLQVNGHIILTTIGLLLILFFYIVYIPLNDWRLDRRLGIIAICWWFIISIINCYL